MRRKLTAVRLGSVPLNDSYVTCHGSDAVRTVAEPPVHVSDAPPAPMTAWSMCPIRLLAVLVIVLLWNVPKRVTLQVTLPPNGSAKLRASHLTSHSLSLTE